MLRSDRYLDFVRGKHCIGCAHPAPSDPHHWSPTRGISFKAPDYRTVPLCRRCHNHFHQHRQIPPHSIQDTRELMLNAQVELLAEFCGTLMNVGA